MILFAAYLLGVQICLGGHDWAGNRGHGGTAAAPGQYRAHRCQPLHDGEVEGFHSDVPQKKCPEGDTRVKQSLEVGWRTYVQRALCSPVGFCLRRITEACAGV